MLVKDCQIVFWTGVQFSLAPPKNDPLVGSFFDTYRLTGW